MPLVVRRIFIDGPIFPTLRTWFIYHSLTFWSLSKANPLSPMSYHSPSSNSIWGNKNKCVLAESSIATANPNIV